jgi:hypothetical protein
MLLADGPCVCSLFELVHCCLERFDQAKSAFVFPSTVLVQLVPLMQHPVRGDDCEERTEKVFSILFVV